MAKGPSSGTRRACPALVVCVFVVAFLTHAPSAFGFSKLSPPNGATGQPTTVTFQWEPAEWYLSVQGYLFCYGIRPDCTRDGGRWESVGLSTSVAVQALPPGTTYYWHVLARIRTLLGYELVDAGGGQWSFTIRGIRRYFAEGAANDFFDCQFAVTNPGGTQGAVIFWFLRDDATAVSYSLEVPSWSRRTVNAKDVPGLTPVGGFSTLVQSEIEVAVDRTMTWDATGYGSHAETGVVAPATTWYLAEGATHSGFGLYYLIQNPNDVPVDVQITYLRPTPLGPIVLTYPGIAPYSRKTIWVNGEHSGLASADVSGVVTSLTPGSPIIVERAMYLNSRGLFFRAGHASAGVTAPATDWFLAEGATGFFDLYVLIANSNPAAAHLTLTYLLPGGATASRPLTVAANSRSTVYVNGEAPAGVSLANTAVSTKVHSDVPVLVERAMWWPSGGPGVWEEAHNSPGTTSAGARWALADGEQGGVRNADTYVLIANTSLFPGTVRVTAMLEDGMTVSREIAVPANSRTTIYMGDFPDPQVSPFGGLLVNKRFGTLIESLPGVSGTAQIVVERAMYSGANGVWWAAGTDVVATRLGLPQ